jgi:hypothetical protein
MKFGLVRRGNSVRSALGRTAVAATLVLGTTGVVNGVTATPALAHYYSGGGASPRFAIKPYHYNPTWQPPLNRALRVWNRTRTPARIVKRSGSRSRLIASRYRATWWGLYVPRGDRRHRYFTIKMNARTIARDANRFSNFVTSVFAHELGHRLSLRDLDSNFDCTPRWDSIMSYCANRNRMIRPQRHDVRDVRRIY